ncbi:2-oxoglutarate dehydrogenase E1 subunit family protein, partial [Clavibacter californiensis]|uniref:2-oxoglutarate dehydrogenase E1 subunit family protein n=1 Tax=Clavibacter californiensis TaxID=1401995 RepID=UPI0036F2FBA9
MTGTGTDDGSTGDFGANEWLVDEMYERFVVDKDSVDRSWWPILENYHTTVIEGREATLATGAQTAEAQIPDADGTSAPASTNTGSPAPTPAPASAGQPDAQ